MTRFSEELKNQNIRLWERICSHPFIEEMIEGNLPLEKFRFYIAQDDLFLEEFCKFIEITILENEDHESWLSELLDVTRNIEMEMHKKLYPKMRAYAPVIVRGEEEKGVRLWSFGKTVYQSLLNIMLDEDYGDITDPVNGRDIVVEFKTSEETGRAFPMTTIRVKPNQTPVTENPDIMKTIKDTQRDIKELYNEMSYDDLHKVLSEWLNQDSDVDDADSKDVTSPVKNDPVKKAQNSTSDVSSAFDELFNN